MKNVDWILVLNRLRPGSQYHWIGESGDGESDSYASIGEWRDPNTIKPTEAECFAEWDVYLAEKAASDAEENQLEQNETTARTGWRDLGAWATWQPQQAQDYVTAEILNGMDVEQIDGWIETNVTSLATAKDALKLLAHNIITMRTVLGIVAKVILYIRDILIKRI